MQVQTPYQKIKQSKPGQFVLHNKVATVAMAGAGALVTAGGAMKSHLVANVAEYGLVPALGAGASALGAAAVHDAFVNDLGEHNGRAATKIGVGTLAALGGAEVVGRSYDIPVLNHALTTPLETFGRHFQAVAGAGVLAGAAYAGKFAVGQFSKLGAEDEHKVRHGALGAGGAVASVAAGLGGVQLLGDHFHVPVADKALTGTIEYLSQGGVGSVLGGAALVSAGAVLGNEAVENFRKGGNDLVTGAETMGAVTAGLGGLELAGHGLGIQALQGLLTEHAETVGGAALTVGGLGLARQTVTSFQKNGLTLGNATTATLAAGLLPGGLSIIGSSLNIPGAGRFGGKSAGLGVSLGLGAVTVALAKDAVASGKNGRVGTAATQALGATVAGTGGLLLAGNSLHIQALENLGEKVADLTWKPVLEHVLRPGAQFLFYHPLAGAAGLAAGAGAYIYYRSKHPDR